MEEFLLNEWKQEYCRFFHSNKHRIVNWASVKHPFLHEYLLQRDVNLIKNIANQLNEEFVLKYGHSGWNWESIADKECVTLSVFRLFPHLLENKLFLSKFTNYTIELLKAYPEVKWDWSKCSQCKGIKMKDIEDHPLFPWDWSKVCCNPNITGEFILKHIKKPLDWNCISSCVNIFQDDIILQLVPYIKFELLVQNRYLKMEFVIRFRHWKWENIEPPVKIFDVLLLPELNWEEHMTWDTFDDITLDIVLDNLHIPWDFEILGKKAFVTMDLFDKFPFTRCNGNSLSSNPNIRIEYVKNHPEKNWNWRNLSENMGISEAEILDNLDLPWDWIDISHRGPVSIHFIAQVLKLKQAPLSWGHLFTRVPLAEILKHPEYPWDFKQSRVVLSISNFYQYIVKYPEKEWNFEYYHAKIYDVMKYPHFKWNWSLVFDDDTLFDINSFFNEYGFLAHRHSTGWSFVVEHRLLVILLLSILEQFQALYRADESYSVQEKAELTISNSDNILKM